MAALPATRVSRERSSPTGVLPNGVVITAALALLSGDSWTLSSGRAQVQHRDIPFVRISIDSLAVWGSSIDGLAIWGAPITAIDRRRGTLLAVDGCWRPVTHR